MKVIPVYALYHTNEVLLPLTMEEILDQIGPWHYMILYLNSVGGFPYPWRVMALQFMAPKSLDYWCARPNGSISLEDWRTLNKGVDLRCFVRDNDGSVNGSVKKCNVWEFDHSYHTRTLIEEWDAVCDQKWLVDSSQSLYMSGMLSTLIFSHISDWYGRRTALRISLVLAIVTGFAVAFTSDFWTFSILRMANSAVGVGFFTLAVECVGTSKRAMMSLSNEFGWFIGLIVFPLITFHVRNWRMLQVISTIPDILHLFCTFFVDESPKWLVSMGRFDEAKDLLSKIVRRNNLQDIDVPAIIKEARKKIENEKKNKPNRRTALDLFRGCIIARTTFACTINYMTVVLIYYELVYFTVELGSNPYLNLVFMALSEAPISITSFFVVYYLRRTPMYSVTYVATISSLIVLLFLRNSSTALRMTFASIAKLSGQVTWSVLYVHMSEIYPTHVRSTVNGVVYTASWFSAVSAPMLNALGEATYAWFPIALTITLSVISWGISFFLPETFGRRLPDTFHESEELLRSRWKKSDQEPKETELTEKTDE